MRIDPITLEIEDTSDHSPKHAWLRIVALISLLCVLVFAIGTQDLLMALFLCSLSIQGIYLLNPFDIRKPPNKIESLIIILAIGLGMSVVGTIVYHFVTVFFENRPVPTMA